jgi:hypothetical protein
MESSHLPRAVAATQVCELQLREGQTDGEAEGLQVACVAGLLPTPAFPTPDHRAQPVDKPTPPVSQWTTIIPNDVVAVAAEWSSAAGWEALGSLDHASGKGGHLGTSWAVGWGPSGQGLLADGGGALARSKLL